ncbi:MAG: hypothetical protein PHY56_00850 [Candidatus Omnitrophica bacterium]|nr:hypothetical protein [Candidatus Omnitrophota bacterium]
MIKLSSILRLLKDLMTKGFTGRIILDFHKGSVSNKVKKEIVEIIE